MTGTLGVLQGRQTSVPDATTFVAGDESGMVHFLRLENGD